MYCVNINEYSRLTFHLYFTCILKYELCVMVKGNVLAENNQYLFLVPTIFLFLTVHQINAFMEQLE